MRTPLASYQLATTDNYLRSYSVFQNLTINFLRNKAVLYSIP